MMDWLAECWDEIWAFFEIEKNSAAVAAIVAVLTLLGGAIAFLIRSLKRSNSDTVVMPADLYRETLRQLHDAKAAELNKAKAEERPPLQAELDEVNDRLRESDKALEEALAQNTRLESELDQERERFGPERIEAAKDALRRFDYSAAEALFTEIRDDPRAPVSAVARAEYGLGEIAEAQVNWAGAASHYRRAAELDPSIDNLNKAAELTMRAGDYATALSLSTRHLDLAKTGTEAEHSRALNLHAILLKAKGRYEKAERLYRKALEIDQALLGEQHPGYATALNNLGGLLQSMGRYEKAERLYRKALEIDKAFFGKQHPDYAIDLNNLASLLQDMDRYDEAEPLYRKALRINQATIGKQHPYYAGGLNNLALLLKTTDRYEEAERLYLQALEIKETALGKQHPDYATALNNLAALYTNQGRWAEAEPLMVQALEIRKATLPADHSYIAQLEKDLATIREKLGKGN